MTVVLDAWPVLRYLEGAHPAAQAIDDLLASQRPAMSWINLGEVHYVLCRQHGEERAESTARDLREVIDARIPRHDDVLAAARIKAAHPLSYADAFAAALAIADDATLWTGDPELLIDDAPWRSHDLR